jgi:hypothetical protein
MKPISVWLVALAAGLLLLDILTFATIYYHFGDSGDWNGTEKIRFDEAVEVSLRNTITCAASITPKSSRSRCTITVQLAISVLAILVIVLLELEN